MILLILWEQGRRDRGDWGVTPPAFGKYDWYFLRFWEVLSPILSCDCSGFQLCLLRFCLKTGKSSWKTALVSKKKKVFSWCFWAMRVENFLKELRISEPPKFCLPLLRFWPVPPALTSSRRLWSTLISSENTSSRKFNYIFHSFVPFYWSQYSQS